MKTNYFRWAGAVSLGLMLAVAGCGDNGTEEYGSQRSPEMTSPGTPEQSEPRPGALTPEPEVERQPPANEQGSPQ